MTKVTIDCPCGRQCKGVAYESPKGWICSACHKRKVADERNEKAKKRRADMRDVVERLKALL